MKFVLKYVFADLLFGFESLTNFDLRMKFLLEWRLGEEVFVEDVSSALLKLKELIFYLLFICTNYIKLIKFT